MHYHCAKPQCRAKHGIAVIQIMFHQKEKRKKRFPLRPVPRMVRYSRFEGHNRKKGYANVSKVYGYVNEKILALLEQGTVPWKRPWSGGASNVPQNYAGHKYRGSNIFLLAIQPFTSPYWLTAKQIAKLGGRFDGKPTMVLYWNWLEPKDGSKKKIPFLRYYNVWNLEQTVGIPVPKRAETVLPTPFTPSQEAERILAETPVRPIIGHGSPRAEYIPSLDRINMPNREAFTPSEAYYGTLFHEMAHATGHASRLDRDMSGSFGAESYSKEELIAEMTAAYLCGHTGIENATLENSAAYIAGWMKRLKTDERLFVNAASAAQKAADMILGTKFEKPEETTEEIGE